VEFPNLYIPGREPLSTCYRNITRSPRHLDAHMHAHTFTFPLFFSPTCSCICLPSIPPFVHPQLPHHLDLDACAYTHAHTHLTLSSLLAHAPMYLPLAFPLNPTIHWPAISPPPQRACVRTHTHTFPFPLPLSPTCLRSFGNVGVTN